MFAVRILIKLMPVPGGVPVPGTPPILCEERNENMEISVVLSTFIFALTCLYASN